MKHYFSLVKFSHTIFALPFALIGFFMGVEQEQNTLSWALLIKVILCMVFARSAAMAFNRYIDRKYDAMNARTAVREIPAGIISPTAALGFVIMMALGFVATTYFINPLCFALSPVALLVVLGYSLTKRFTALCHLVLGLGLSLAPIGAYLAVTGRFDALPLLISGAVLFWTGGFDIIYALQDEGFDRSQNLYSIPVWLGRKGALLLSRVLHAISAAFIIIVGYWGQLGFLYAMGAGIFIALLAYQHYLVKPNDLSKINLAFFTTNGIASVVFSAFFITAHFLR